MRRMILLSASVALAAGCSGNVETRTLAPTALAANSALNGVLYYLPMYARMTYTFHSHVDKDGNLDAKQCAPVVQKEEVSLVADLSRPVLIRNASGTFSAAKFAVSLDKGLLTSVNVEPTQKASDLLAGVASLVKEVGVVAKQETTKLDLASACNAGPLVTIGKVTFQ